MTEAPSPTNMDTAALAFEVQRIEKLLVLDPRSEETWGHYGEVLLALCRHEDALRAFEYELRLNPKSAEAHFRLGVALERCGRGREAVDRYSQALSIKPDCVEAWNGIGNVLAGAGQPGEAAGCFERAIALDSGFVVAVNSLGLMRCHLGQWDEATVLFRRVLTQEPDYPGTFSNLGFTYYRLGRMDEAEAAYRKAADQQPGSSKAWDDLGILLSEREKWEEAAGSFERAAALSPDSVQVINNLGAMYVKLGRLDEAEELFRKVLGLRPDHADACNNLGLARLRRGRLGEAEELFRQAVGMQPGLPKSHNHLGMVLRMQGRLGESIAACRQALALQPDSPEALMNLGNSLRDSGRVAEAISALEEALRLRSDIPGLHLNLGLYLLTVGRLEEGWREYEWRWRCPEFAPVARAYTGPRWRGEAAPGKVLLLWAEQGFGDTLQFCRYAPLAAKRGLRVVLTAQPGLVRLLKSLDGVETIVGMGSPVPDHDFQCPLMSLPGIFGTEVGSIPASVPYLSAEEDEVRAWRERLDDAPPGSLKVGLVWAGRSRLDSPELVATDRRRSISPVMMVSLLDVPGGRYYSLQKEGPAASAGYGLIDFMGECRDFCDTAAFITNLDLVISVDTAVVHLAGALGKPVWVLNRFDSCWRWLQDREDSPWYPTLRLFTQRRPGEWGDVIARLREELEKYAPDSRPDTRRKEGWTGRNASVSAGGDVLMGDGEVQHLEKSLAQDPRSADTWHRYGVALLARKRWGDAVHAFTYAVRLDPGAAEARYRLGIALWGSGRSDEAVEVFQQTLSIKPDYPEVLNDLGSILEGRGSLAEAGLCFERAVSLAPHFVTAISNLGLVRSKLGDLDGAAELFRRVLVLVPNQPEAYIHLGKVLCLKEAFEEGIDSFRRAAELRPDSPEDRYRLGLAYAACGRRSEAVAAYNQALSLKPDYTDALNDLGNVLREQGRFVEAQTCFERALEIDPCSTAILNNLGLTFFRLGRLDEAVTAYRKALALQSDLPEVISNLGQVLRLQNKLEESMTCYEQALALRPDFPEALANLACTFSDSRRHSEALPLLKRAVDLKGDLGDIHLNLAMVLLALGRFEEGWREFEWRWQNAELAPMRKMYTQPLWKGEAAEGRSLLLWVEQGFGDTIQFCRYVPLVAARGLRVLLRVEPPLVRLLRPLQGVEQIVRTDEAVPVTDLQCPLMSLPRVFDTRLENIPAEVPYLVPDREAVLAWKRKIFRGPGDRLKVGLVWAGSSRRNLPLLAAIDRRRSIAPEMLMPLLDVEGVRFYSLQKDGPPAPAGFGLIDYMGDCLDFADTAALIANLDLVISVDTSVVHLAGALGKPVWVLNRFDSCWRWLIDREDSPWYPALRLFNQDRPGDWEGVIVRVLAELERYRSVH